MHKNYQLGVQLIPFDESSFQRMCIISKKSGLPVGPVTWCVNHRFEIFQITRPAFGLLGQTAVSLAEVVTRPGTECATRPQLHEWWPPVAQEPLNRQSINLAPSQAVIHQVCMESPVQMLFLIPSLALNSAFASQKVWLGLSFFSTNFPNSYTGAMS